ncbi:MAG: MBL fold metallo-hydrolase [Oscillospiraceae bacterium]|nr:MBL fold metallo-hydrolase [Oscillospiraceae bacterium]
MIRLIPIASGSSGNCMLAELDGKRILIDIGVSYKALCLALRENGLTPADLDAVLITHSHSDHVKGLPVTQKHLSCPLFMSDGTSRALACDEAEILPYDRKAELLPGIRVTAFRTSHDCMGSVGYLLESGQQRLGYATDLGVLTEEIRQLLAGADVIVLESNHDEEMLRTGPYPYPLKRRILSDSGHLSNRACCEGLRYFMLNGTRHFLLAHLSKENNRPEIALNLARETVAGGDAFVDVLPVSGGNIFCLE